jgi:large subunit ribosomal protein L25
MPEIISLTAEPRDRAGKGAARAARRSGRVPGIIYGGGETPVQITLDPRELSRAVNRAGFFATVVDVSLSGAVHRTLAREVQLHPVSDVALHVDFMRVAAGAQVTVSVPVGFINQENAPGLRRGGIPTSSAIPSTSPARSTPSPIGSPSISLAWRSATACISRR